MLYCACLTQWNSPKSANPSHLALQSDSSKCLMNDFKYHLNPDLNLSSADTETLRIGYVSCKDSSRTFGYRLNFFKYPKIHLDREFRKLLLSDSLLWLFLWAGKSKMLINHMLLLFIFSKCSLITAMLSERPCRFPAWVHLHWYFSPMCLPLCALLFSMIIFTHILKWWRSFLKAQDQRN